MKTPTPKVLFDVAGRPSLVHVARQALALCAEESVVVVSPENESASRSALDAAGFRDARLVTQDPPLGTGHAVRVGIEAIAAPDGDLLILYGDGPLLRPESLEELLAHHRRSGASATLLTTVRENPRGYGRIVRSVEGRVERVVEELDADPDTRAIRETNTGVLVLRLDVGRPAVEEIGNDNAKGEYYLTDLTELLRARGATVERVLLADSREAAAFNSHEELAEVRELMRQRIICRHQQAGVDIVDPKTTYIDDDVVIGAGTRILPCTVIGAGVRIGSGCVVGPFSHLRLETTLGDRSQIGNFTEVKQSVVGEGVRAKHLSYLGDATIGAGTNIGCGTITANWDGKDRHATVIGEGAFIGSGTVLVAPTEVGPGGVTGAGAIVLRNERIGAGEVYVGVPARPLRKDASQRDPRSQSPDGEPHS